jgi:hypothetical protein
MKRGYERVGVQNAVVAGTRKPERRRRRGGQVYSDPPSYTYSLWHDKCVSTVNNNST